MKVSHEIRDKVHIVGRNSDGISSCRPLADRKMAQHLCYKKTLKKVSVMMKISPVSLRTGAHTGVAIYGGYFIKLRVGEDDALWYQAFKAFAAK